MALRPNRKIDKEQMSEQNHEPAHRPDEGEVAGALEETMVGLTKRPEREGERSQEDEAPPQAPR